MKTMIKEQIVRDKYGNRKRGDSWEGRVFLLKENISLYDTDTRRLEIRKLQLRQKCEELVTMYNEYRKMLNTVFYVTPEYYDKLKHECDQLYNEICTIVNARRKTKFFETVDSIYNNLCGILDNYKLNFTNQNNIYPDKKVEDWFYEWLWTYKYGHKAKTTFMGYYNKTKNHIIKKFGKRYLSEITTTEIQQFINDLIKEYKPATIKQIYLLLREGYERAVKDKIIQSSPVIDIEIPSIIPNAMQSVKINDEKTLINLFSKDEMCYPYAVLIDTGLRSSELCGLKWENVDFHNRRIYIRQSLQRVNNYEFIDGKIEKVGSSVEETELKSRTSKRSIPMSDGVYNILLIIYNETLKKYKRVNPESFVFITTSGNPITGDCLRGRLDDLLKRHHLESVSLHRFRHTFATRLYEAEVKLKNIQALLGHSTIQMTERYLHIEEEDQTDSIKLLEEFNKKNGLLISV